MIPSMTRYAAATRSRSLPAGIWAFGLFEIWIKTTRNFPLATVAMAYWEHAEYKLLL